MSNSSKPASDFFGEQLFLEPFKSLLPLCGGKTQVAKNAKPSGLFGKTSLVKPFTFPASPHEYKVIALRECPTPDYLQIGDTPQRIAEYWRLHVPTHPHFDPERECFVVFILNTRKRIKGHQLVSTGLMDSVAIHPREVFRLAVTTCAASIVLAHNHPSGEPQPSEADIKITRDLIRAGQLMKIEVLDHVIMGNQSHCSLKEMGFFYS